jgi:hypothetical protein
MRYQTVTGAWTVARWGKMEIFRQMGLCDAIEGVGDDRSRHVGWVVAWREASPDLAVGGTVRG